MSRGAGSIRAKRLRAQLLAGSPARDPVTVAARLLAIQAQDRRGARLAIRARTEGLTVADVDRALSDERSLVSTWLNRGTLHLVRREDYAWLHALTTPPLLTGNARRLKQEGVSPSAEARALVTIERALADEGPLTRSRLDERIAAAGVRTEGQAIVHLLGLASHRGLIVRGPVQGGEEAFALVRDWIGEQPSIPREQALAELARRYLGGHAPASDRDLARWSGLPLRDARAGLGAIAAELVQREDGLVELARTRAAEPAPPRLLGAFDPLLLGWRERGFVLGPDEPAIVSGGVFRPFAIAGGVAVARWRINAGAVELEPLRDIATADARALQDDAADVVRFLKVRDESWVLKQ